MMREILAAIAEYPWAFIGLVIGLTSVLGAVAACIPSRRR